ncbi:MAG: LysR family transcriptional regulator [Pseudomonadota bacterium]
MLIGFMAGAAAETPIPRVAANLDLNLLMVFLEVVNAGSIGRAAVRTQIPKATLSRKLRQLEGQVGAVLLKRGPHRVELTEIGRALHEHCERIASVAQDVSQIASEMQSEVRGALRVSMPFGLRNAWMTQALASFVLRFPEVRLNVNVTNRWVDVSEEPCDVAIHIGRIRNENLPVRRLADLPRGLYAAPEYLAGRDPPLVDGDLLEHECIALETQIADGLWKVTAPGCGTVSVTPRLTTTDIVLARDMALAGAGIAMLTDPVCECDVRQGRLVRVLPDRALPPVSISAMYLERRHLPARIRMFIDAVAAAIEGAGLSVRR